MVVFDLDPGSPATIIECARVALWLREIFENYNLKSFPKTSGSKGLQLYVPLNTYIDYDQTKNFAHRLARELAEKYPGQVTANMRKQLRAGKVFIDWSQNDIHKTTVCAYSLRAKERPLVSTPITWDEVEAVLIHKNLALLEFDSRQVLERIDKLGDLFAPLISLRQSLPTQELT